MWALAYGHQCAILGCAPGAGGPEFCKAILQHDRGCFHLFTDAQGRYRLAYYFAGALYRPQLATTTSR